MEQLFREQPHPYYASLLRGKKLFCSAWSTQVEGLSAPPNTRCPKVVFVEISELQAKQSDNENMLNSCGPQLPLQGSRTHNEAEGNNSTLISFGL